MRHDRHIRYLFQVFSASSTDVVGNMTGTDMVKTKRIGTRNSSMIRPSQLCNEKEKKRRKVMSEQAWKASFYSALTMTSSSTSFPAVGNAHIHHIQLAFTSYLLQSFKIQCTVGPETIQELPHRGVGYGY